MYSVCPRPSLVNGLYCTGAKVLHFTIIVNRTNVLQVLFFCIFLFSMVLCFNTRPEKQLFLARSFFFYPRGRHCLQVHVLQIFFWFLQSHDSGYNVPTLRCDAATSGSRTFHCGDFFFPAGPTFCVLGYC